MFSSVTKNKINFIFNLTYKNNEKNLKMFIKHSPRYFFVNKHQQKKYLIVNNPKKKTENFTNNYSSKYIFNVVLARFLLFKNQKNRKRLKQPKTLIFNFLKNYLKAFLYLLKNKKMYKFNKNVNRFVFKPNFNLIKNKQTVVRFSKLYSKIKQTKNLKPKKKKKKFK